MWSWALFLTPLGLSFLIYIMGIITAPFYKVFLRSQWVNICRALRIVFDTYNKPSKCLFYSALKITSTLHTQSHLIHMTAMRKHYHYLYLNLDLSSSSTHIFFIIIKNEFILSFRTLCCFLHIMSWAYKKSICPFRKAFQERTYSQTF